MSREFTRKSFNKQQWDAMLKMALVHPQACHWDREFCDQRTWFALIDKDLISNGQLTGKALKALSECYPNECPILLAADASPIREAKPPIFAVN